MNATKVLFILRNLVAVSDSVYGYAVACCFISWILFNVSFSLMVECSVLYVLVRYNMGMGCCNLILIFHILLKINGCNALFSLLLSINE